MPTPKINGLLERPVIVVALIVLAALALRLTNISASSLWIDEIYSLIVGNTHLFPDTLTATIQPAQAYYDRFLSWQPMDFERLMALLKINVHMPLYYLLLNPWLQWFGNNSEGLRSFSALFSALMILPVYWLGAAVGGKKAGYLAALVAALSPFQIYQGQEGRMYTLSLFWTALAGFAFWKVLFSNRPTRWGWCYALAVGGGMLTHYMFVFFLGFQFLFGLYWLCRSKDFKRLLCLLPALGGLLGIAWWWLPVYQLQQQGINEEYHFAKGLVAWTRYLSVPIWQPMVVAAGDNKLIRSFYFPVTVLLSLLLVAGFRKKNGDAKFKQEGYLLSWILIPLLLQVAYDLIKGTHISIIDRYAMLISPAMCVWLGLGLHRLLTPSDSATPERPDQTKAKRSQPRATILILVGMALLALANVSTPSPFRDEHNKTKDIRGMMRHFAQVSQPTDLVLANGLLGTPNIAAYYLRMVNPQQPLLYWVSEWQGNPVTLPPTEAFKPYGRVWLFSYRSNNERGLQIIKDYLESMYPHVQEDGQWFIFSR